MARGWWFAVLTGAVVALFGCEDEGSSEKSSEEQSSDEKNSKSAAPKLDQHRVYMNLYDRVHLADVHHHGLYVDFGTPARMKYTVGHWRTKWGNDRSSGDTPYTHASKRGRIYFQVDDPGPRTIRLRLRPIGAQKVSPYVNGEGIELIQFQENSGFRNYDIQVPGDQIEQGENTLLLVFGSTKKMGGEKVSVAMDSIRVIEGEKASDDDYTPPRYGNLKAKVKLGDDERDALVTRRPTRLSYYVQVPEAAKLGFDVGFEGKGKAKVRVRARPQGGKAKELFSGKIGSEWTRQVVDLSSYAGKIVRLDLEVLGEGSGRVAWSKPALHVPKPEEAERPERAKNVIVLLIDTLRASKVKAYNPDTRVKTPTMTKFAEEGMLFQASQAPENWTKPSCASVLTSLYPVSHGTKKDDSSLPSSALTLGEHYQANGFTTGSFIANGYVSRKFGFDQGWDHHTNYIRESKATEAENVFAEAGDWIKNHKDERFFAYIQTIDPHVPYDPPDKYLKMYDDKPYSGKVKPRMTAQLLGKAKSGDIEFSERDKERLEALYDGEVTYHDHYFGKFVERLRKMGVYDDTLFVITSDHGEEFNEHGSWGHGHSTYQELLHVPLMFRFPGAVPQGKVVQQTVSILDIGPTIMELTGTKRLPEGEGESLVGYMTGEIPTGPKVAFSDFLNDQRVIRAGRWKLTLRGLNVRFFDLQNDPAEQNPLEPSDHPIAFRYGRVMLGQFLGASDRANWLDANQGKGTDLTADEAHIDEETEDQLRALGYAN
jgi:arylsulfatase A-like enzyme